MKKFIYISLMSLISLVPFLAFAQIELGTIPTAGDLGFDEDEQVPVENYQGVLGIVARIVRFIYIAFFIVAIVFILFAAFNYLTGANTPDKIASAHKQLVYAAIAIAVALLAVSMQLIVASFLRDGGNTATNNNNQFESDFSDGILR